MNFKKSLFIEFPFAFLSILKTAQCKISTFPLQLFILFPHSAAHPAAPFAA
jgi:hypothetical protein